MAMDDFPSADERGDAEEDLFDFPPAEASHSQGAGPPAQRTYTGMDPELDVDIFDFPPMQCAPAHEPSALAGGELEASIDQASKSVNHLLEDDLGEMIEEHRQERKERAEESDADAAPEPQSAEDAALPSTLPNPPISPTVTVAGGASRLQQTLAATAILFLVGLFALAWRLTTTFSQSLERVRDDVDAGNRVLEEQSATQLQRIAELESRLLEERARARAESSLANTLPRGQGEADVRSPAQLSLVAARSAIEDGEFAAARRILYSDLAKLDSLPPEARAETAATMEFLVAHSYKLEAESFAEVER